MPDGRILTDENEIRSLLTQIKIVAVLGVSPKPNRDSHRVAKYLKDHGYRIIPVRPGQKEILGEKAYASLNEVRGIVDCVNVFRRSEQVMEHAKESLRIKPRAFWMQLNIENEAAARLLTENGIDVVMNRCIKIEHARIFQ
ncbi:MAG: CoA-binding protein [Desulfobacterales bacterium CG07_land_8_20_14_0_80_52_14]|nr:MAG: CoA-binding protein [Desulfobacterales bacterium CG07_land_8_20_14_0_80_52_14]